MRFHEAFWRFGGVDRRIFRIVDFQHQEYIDLKLVLVCLPRVGR